MHVLSASWCGGVQQEFGKSNHRSTKQSTFLDCLMQFMECLMQFMEYLVQFMECLMQFMECFILFHEWLWMLSILHRKRQCETMWNI